MALTLAIRVIATLLIDPARGVIKGRQFAHDRVIGEPIQWARVMAQLREVDELVVFDVTHHAPAIELLKRIAAECWVPLAYGGGVHTAEDVRELRNIAEKIVTDSPRVLRMVSETMGGQAAVGVINESGVVADMARHYVEAGAGEILLQSRSHDGMMDGYDLEAISRVRAAIDVPLIASSGAGSPADCVAAVRAGADAVACGAMYAFSDTTPNDVKRALHAAGYPVRLMEAV